MNIQEFPKEALDTLGIKKWLEQPKQDLAIWVAPSKYKYFTFCTLYFIVKKLPKNVRLKTNISFLGS